MMSEKLGKLHFWGSFIGMNMVFMPMFSQGLAGVARRMYDQTFYAHGKAVQDLTVIQSWGAWFLGACQIFFIVNFFLSIKNGREVKENPWEATTLEWAAPSPPPHGNFVTEPVVYREPYEYSVPGASADFSPQFNENV